MHLPHVFTVPSLPMYRAVLRYLLEVPRYGSNLTRYLPSTYRYCNPLPKTVSSGPGGDGSLYEAVLSGTVGPQMMCRMVEKR